MSFITIAKSVMKAPTTFAFDASALLKDVNTGSDLVGRLGTIMSEKRRREVIHQITNLRISLLDSDIDGHPRQ